MIDARMTVNLTRIYTKLGDGGETHLGDMSRVSKVHPRVGPDYTEWLERACDEVNATLAPLRSFVIPGGTAAAAHLHVCRTVCRRAERRAIAVGEHGNAEVVRYLNRLSDLLFILSRAANNEGEGDGEEPLWQPGAHEAEERSKP
jgi:cob(I)alamin adenosyltransferase